MPKYFFLHGTESGEPFLKSSLKLIGWYEFISKANLLVMVGSNICFFLEPYVLRKEFKSGMEIYIIT